MCLPLSLSRYYMYVYTYYIHYVRIYVCIILLKPSLRPPFVGSFEKSSDLARPQLQRFPSPSLPSYFRQKKIARTAGIRPSRIPNARDSSREREFALVARLPCDGGRRSFVFLIAFVSFSPSFFFFSLSTEDRRKANESHRAGQ